MNDNEIIINEINFSKISKKLNTKIKDLGLNLNLSKTQEILAESLGSRNLHDLQKKFKSVKSSNTNIKSTKNNENIFDKLDVEKSISLILSLIDEKMNNYMNNSVIELITIVMNYLYELKNKIDTKIIKEYLLLDNLLEIKNGNVRKILKEQIEDYFIGLPGFTNFTENYKKNYAAVEQHNYIRKQISQAIRIIEKIENNDFIIADISWMETDKKYFNKKLEKLDCLNNGWFFTKEYEDLIYELIDRKVLKTLRVSDLLLEIANNVSIEKKSSILRLLISIINNYSLSENISKTICEENKK